MDHEALRNMEKQLLEQQQQASPPTDEQIQEGLDKVLKMFAPSGESPENLMQKSMKKMFVKLLLFSLGTSFIGGAAGALVTWGLIVISIG